MESYTLHWCSVMFLSELNSLLGPLLFIVYINDLSEIYDGLAAFL